MQILIEHRSFTFCTVIKLMILEPLVILTVINYF